ALRQVAGRQGAGPLGPTPRAAVSGGGDPRRTMDVEADVVVAAESPFAGVETHPHADRRRLRPRSRSEPALCLGSGGDPIEGRAKDREEGIPLGADLDPSVSGDRITEELVVRREQGRISITKRRKKSCRAFDVGEEERHRTDGQAALRDRWHSRAPASRSWLQPSLALSGKRERR